MTTTTLDPAPPQLDADTRSRIASVAAELIRRGTRILETLSIDTPYSTVLWNDGSTLKELGEVLEVISEACPGPQVRRCRSCGIRRITDTAWRQPDPDHWRCPACATRSAE